MPMCVLIFLDFQLKPFLFPKEFKSGIATTVLSSNELTLVRVWTALVSGRAIASNESRDVIVQDVYGIENSKQFANDSMAKQSNQVCFWRIRLCNGSDRYVV
jgi:hypothetical protein